jgi:endogenous inhibitor of DNA gyrase (YacG/DUF329 family)
MTPPTSTGRCPVCGHDFTTNAHQRPRRRYCSDHCRKTAWRHRHPRTRHPAVPRPDPVAQPGDVTQHGDVAPDVAAELPVTARAEPVARCPHCARPIAVIALLVNPAAATVPTPGARHAQ